jgi:S-DNA-T family DNA segregation ATPase FtsK/SpoIIIE
VRLVYAAQGVAYDLDADIERPDAAVADLAVALGAPPDAGTGPPGLFVDGLYRPGDFALVEAGLHDGAIVSFAPPANDAERPAGWVDGLYVTVLTGADAGRAVPVTHDAAFTVGRDPDCHVRLGDPTVSRHHCRLDVSRVGMVTVTNLSASVGTRVDGVLLDAPAVIGLGVPVLVGSVLLSVGPLGSGDRVSGFDQALRLGGQGTVSLNRPPRLRVTPVQPVLSPPVLPDTAGKAPFNVASLVAPVVMGVAMAAIFMSALYLSFALLSPMMAVGNWWEGKHRSSKNLRRSTREFARDLERFAATLDAAHADVTATRRAAVPDPAEVARRALLPSALVWERRRGDDDFLQLGLGCCDEEWRPLLSDPRAVPAADVLALIAARSTLFDVPEVVALGEGGVVGIVGPRPWAGGGAQPRVPGRRAARSR